ncbi:MAG TPA: PD-(D/E)XK nuclease family protein [Solirubrobacteraceae bacterium]|nr:PD-(D/E)XK nuclease family protein [Solirubrobacteraceae bacterium]
MGLTLVTGPANSAKAQVVLERYRLALARGPILVVPRAADAEHYSRELARAGAVLGVRVEPFSGLLAEIARRGGVGGVAIGEAARERVLGAVIARTPLELLEPAAQAPGFARALAGFVAELEARRATPARFASALAAWAGPSTRRARYGSELAALYRGYRRALERIGRLDRELLAIRALDALRLAPARWGRTPVFCYGFDDLDPLQLDAIETLAHHVGAQVTISLPGEGGRIALAERAGTLETLRPGADEVIALDPDERFYEDPALHHLERSLFEDDPSPRSGAGDAVTLFEGGDERAEAELIGAEIERLLAAGCAPGDVAVVTRGAASVGALVAEVLDARGITHTEPRRERFADTALGGGVLALLRAALLDGGASDLVRWLRVPGVVAHGAFVDRFEADLLKRGIGKLAPARAVWEAEHWPLDALERLAEAARRPGVALIERVEREAESLLAAPSRREAAPLDRWQAAVLACCRRALRELRELARADASLEGGAGAIVAALEGSVVELAPATEADAVLICDALALRARRVRALFVAGLQEGEFPAAVREEAFLSAAERAELAQASGLALSGPPSAERYLFYALCSRATRWLALSWHDAADNGDAAVRSLFVDDLVDCFGEELFERRSVRGAGAVAWGAPPPAAPTLARLQAALAAPRRRAGVLGPVREPELLQRLRGRDSYSPSALENWCSCPVAWLVERALHAEQLEPQSIWIARGSAAHEVLSELFAALARERGSARIDEQSLPAALELLERVLAAHAEPLSPNAGVERAERRRLRSDLRRYLSFAAGSASTHEPRELELAFGLDGAELPAVSLGPSQLALSGRIDRIDIDAAAGTALVYDYKTGSVDAAANWAENRRLQQALYMLAVEQLLEVEVVGGLYQPLRSPDLRPRGAIREDVDPDAALFENDRVSAQQLRELVAVALDTATAAAAELRDGELAPRPPTCTSGGGCRYPGICRVEAR